MVDYQRNCTGSNTVNKCAVCVAATGVCKATGVCAFNCPAPLAHSTLAANRCAAKTFPCANAGIDCIDSSECPELDCAALGAFEINKCDYNCDAGYVWNGVACVAGAKVVGQEGKMPFYIPAGVSPAVLKVKK